MLAKSQLNTYIERAVAVLRSSPNSRDQEVFEALVMTGLDPFVASRLTLFLPMAYCRLMLMKSGAQFSERFREVLSNGSLSEERLLASEPLWTETSAFVAAELMAGVTRNDVMALAARSAEFAAANKLLNNGSHLGDLRFTAPILAWPVSKAKS